MTYDWQQHDTIPGWAIAALMAGIDLDDFNETDNSAHRQKVTTWWPIIESAVVSGKLKVCSVDEDLSATHFDTDSFRSWAAGRGKNFASAKARGYSTIYMDAMEAAIQHFGISHTYQGPKKAVIEEWIFEELKRKGDPSINKAKILATAIRHPESQRGGNKRQ